ncbi:MAG TPA: formylglycine-generating enzyme family protein [Opitutaceae bacterium]|nr:formylglycine-generating enzyme family protein [Opitutaceae bacterium]
MKTSLLPSGGRRARCALAVLAVACSAILLSAAEPRTVPGLGLTLMPIPAGTFAMGAPGRNESDRPPPHVTISQPFWLGRTEVTQGQWKALMGTDVVEQVRRQLAEDRLAGKQLSKRDGVNRTGVSDPNQLVYNTADDAPMYWVSWEEAVAFCRRLTERERAEGRVPEGYEYRLPTDAEWEYAARAGTTTATYAGELEIKAFADGRVLDPIAWYRGNSSEGYTGKGVNTSDWPAKQYPGGVAGPHAVATKLPNAWGLHDMLGNVWEWCGDWYSYQLPGGGVSDPTGPVARSTVQQAAFLAAGGGLTHETSKGAGRVIRGGSWPAATHVVHASSRIWQMPGQRESALGFRVALAPQLSR